MGRRGGSLETLERLGTAARNIPKDRLLSSFSVLSSATLAAIVFSVITNKTIAIIAGPDGIALMGLYRTLGSMVSGAIAVGFATIVVQRVSRATRKEEIDEILGAATLLFVLQTMLVAVLAVAAAAPIGRWLLGASVTGASATEVRIVLGMSLVNVLLGLVTAALNGQTNVRPITIVQLATALASLAMIYPLLRIGNQGLALNVGSGGIVGACVGLYYVRGIFRFSIGGSLAEKWSMLRASVSTSGWLIAQNLVVMGGLLAVQNAVATAHGLEALGGFNAAMLIVDTMILVIMSPARTYCLPALGRLTDDLAKRSLLNRVLFLRVSAMTAAAALLIFGGKPILALLFSRQFMAAGDLLSILSLSLVALSFSWTCNSYLLHKSDIRTYVIIDMIWIAAMISSVLACRFLGLSAWAMAWSYTASCVLSAILYGSVCAGRYGPGLPAGGNIGFGVACVLWLMASLLAARQLSFLGQGVFICVSIGAAWVLGLGRQVMEWLELEKEGAAR